MKYPRYGRSHYTFTRQSPGPTGSSVKFFFVGDPRSVGLHASVAATESNIPNIPRGNENRYMIPDPPRSRILISTYPGSWAFLGSWHVPASYLNPVFVQTIIMVLDIRILSMNLFYNASFEFHLYHHPVILSSLSSVSLNISQP